MSILLTDEEIVAEASKDSTYCQLSVDIGMWAAKEQLKKVVEWIENRGAIMEFINMHYEEDWQALMGRE